MDAGQSVVLARVDWTIVFDVEPCPFLCHYFTFHHFKCIMRCFLLSIIQLDSGCDTNGLDICGAACMIGAGWKPGCNWLDMGIRSTC